MNTALLVVFSYLLGSIPTGYWLVKALKGIDLRQVGSGSTGATNVLRTAGKGLAAIAFVIDMLKGFLPVWLAVVAVERGWLPEWQAMGAAFMLAWVPPLAGIASVIGHSKSVFLNFQGGKSAATGGGTLIGCDALAGVSSVVFWLLVLAGGRMVSLASLAAAVTCPVFMWFFTRDMPLFHWSFTLYAAVGALYVVARHKANIQRLLAGTEPRIGQKLEDAAAKARQKSA